MGNGICSSVGAACGWVLRSEAPTSWSGLQFPDAGPRAVSRGRGHPQPPELARFQRCLLLSLVSSVDVVGIWPGTEELLGRGDERMAHASHHRLAPQDWRGGREDDRAASSPTTGASGALLDCRAMMRVVPLPPPIRGARWGTGIFVILAVLLTMHVLDCPGGTDAPSTMRHGAMGMPSVDANAAPVGMTGPSAGVGVSVAGVARDEGSRDSMAALCVALVLLMLAGVRPVASPSRPGLRRPSWRPPPRVRVQAATSVRLPLQLAVQRC